MHDYKYDRLCSNHDEHIYNIQLFIHIYIVDMCLSASEMCIPHTSDNCNGSHNIAGWNDIVKPFKEASLFLAWCVERLRLTP